MRKMWGWEGAGSPGDMLLGQLVATKHKSNFFKRPENAGGGQMESRKSKAVHSHVQRRFPAAWSAEGNWNHWERK